MSLNNSLILFIKEKMLQLKEVFHTLIHSYLNKKKN